MKLYLLRSEKKEAGIFGQLTDDISKKLFATLEHAFIGSDGFSWIAKIPVGVWVCQRSMHRLHGMTEDFETFEVMNVPGHDNLLFHWGNYNKDSEGCILIGHERSGDMITGSRDAFKDFMALQDGLDTFQLIVQD